MFGELIATWDRAKKLNAFEERHLDCLNIIVMRWNFGASNEILGFAFLLFLWDNGSQKLRIPSHFAKCEPLIRTLSILCSFMSFSLFIYFTLWFCFLVAQKTSDIKWGSTKDVTWQEVSRPSINLLQVR